MIGLFVIGGVALFLGLTLTPLGRTIGNGAKQLFMKNAMKDPTAAEALYLAAIDEEEKNFEEAGKLLRTYTGMLVDANAGYTKAENDLATIEEKCDKLMKSGNEDGARLLIRKRSALIQTRDSFYNSMVELKPMVEEARELHNQYETNVEKLKHDKTIKINEMRLSKSATNLYDRMNKLKGSSATQKLLGHIDDNIKEQKRDAAGGKMVYENKLETQEQRLEQSILSSDEDDYLKQLKEKYNK